FTHRPRRLVDREVRVSVAGGVRVGDRHSADGLSRLREHLVVIVIGVEQRVGDITVAVWPAIDGDRRNVAPAGEAARPQHAVELLADARLEVGKAHAEKPLLADPELLARGEALVGGTRDVDEVQAYRL